MKKILFVFITVMTLVFAGCIQHEKTMNFKNAGTGVKIKITNWNIQTFFDADNDGFEYDEFKKSKNWGTEMYKTRLERLCKSIRQIDPDILVLEEIENEGILYDMSNFLSDEWNFKKIYNWACFAAEQGSGIGVAVISRYELKDMSVHGLSLKAEGAAPMMRPLLKVNVDAGAKDFVLFVNHWKSMSGGKEVSEKWRNAQEAVLSREVSAALKEGMSVFIAGDFNRDINDFFFSELKSGQVLLREGRGTFLFNQGAYVDSLWFDKDGALIEPGSYNFRNTWSRIDNMFFCGDIKIISFFPETEGPWCDRESAAPVKYSLWNGSGYSDHLPVSCIFVF